MKISHLNFLAATLWVGFAQLAWAVTPPALPPAQFLTTKPGTTLVWLDVKEETRNAIRIAPRAGNQIRYITESGEVRDDYLMCWFCAGLEFDESQYEELWPLEVGKRVKFVRTSKDENKQWVNKIKVDRTEKIELPFGTVDTYVVETSSWIRGTARWYGKATYWFAPALGWVVKTRSSDIFSNKHEYLLVDVRIN